MRKSLLVPLLLTSAIAAGLTLTFGLAAGSPGDHIPNVGSIDVSADDAANGHAPEAVPPEAAADGLATAQEAAGGGGPAVGSIDVPANDAAGDHPPEAVPPADAGDHIPAVESISVPADDAAGDNAVAAVPPQAAATGLGTAASAAP